MTGLSEEQRALLTLLAEVYFDVDRPKRALALASLAATGLDPRPVRLTRLILKARMQIGDYTHVLDDIDTLLEHEYDATELAFALSVQSTLLRRRSEARAAREVWAQLLSLCKVSGLSVEDVIQ